MTLEQDIVGLTIMEALHAAVEKGDGEQIDRLSRLHNLYYQLTAEGLKPTEAGEIARPLREKLGLEKQITENGIRERTRSSILNTRQGDLPIIEDVKTREFAERLNLQIGRFIEDEVELKALSLSWKPRHPGPIDWIRFWETLVSSERQLINRSVNLYIRNWVENVGELRTIDPLAMKGFRLAGDKSILLPTILERKAEEPLNT